MSRIAHQPGAGGPADDAVSQPRSLAARYFLCSDLRLAALLLLVVGGVGALVLLAGGQGTAAGSVAQGVVVDLAVVLGAWALLRLPSRTEQRVAARSGTGFAEVGAVRERLRRGEPLDAAAQEVADDLARVVSRRLGLGRSIGFVVVLAFLVVGVSFALSRQVAGQSQLVATIAHLVVFVAVGVAEVRRTRSVRADLLAATRRG
ncbi:hypothetical protein [Lapillicoccus jejuensis]|uniref:Uncharacterized protein n=1 Tax=Lapillicoccus jejuensis TaxID=402171 RepID=A0A542E4T9_9MICO|nr:hypothetical protein [Lapillicoccus jejuensis]TQJ10296.1 hypothetical protein FB458_3416 [Lapillicoccus jejuensis]